MLKKIFYCLLFCFLGTYLSAQILLPRGIAVEKEPTPLCTELNKIIADYPNNFEAIKGERLRKSQYQSLVLMPQAVEVLLVEEMDENFDSKYIYKAMFSKDLPWKEAVQKVYEIGEEIGGCAKAGAGRFIHSIDDNKNKQMSIFLPYKPEAGFEQLEIRLSITKEMVNETPYGIITLTVGKMD